MQKKGNSIVNLLRDTVRGLAIGWGKSIIETKGASACAESAVSVRAREACVNGDFLGSSAKLFLRIARIGVVSAFVAPSVRHFIVRLCRGDCLRMDLECEASSCQD